MIAAMLAARNILAGQEKYDIGAVNEDGEYHEAGRTGEQSQGSASSMAAITASS